ncbi:hypothetical protein NECAME_04429 [Necator americanus]|uniref:Uncharacterized protein n=1 Tax=Necator americanus TaxID=51031 RepID=W2SVK0_NECAM|nr:hypothetical protein NECAME_04429 [Necator americanus]ETN72821.1 hypothetical protein NECAME_04429 [Necator americanus]
MDCVLCAYVKDIDEVLVTIRLVELVEEDTTLFFVLFLEVEDVLTQVTIGRLVGNCRIIERGIAPVETHIHLGVQHGVVQDHEIILEVVPITGAKAAIGVGRIQDRGHHQITYPSDYLLEDTNTTLRQEIVVEDHTVLYHLRLII